MRNFFKQIFYQIHKYPRSDRNALLILSALILCVLVTNGIYNAVKKTPKINPSDYEKLLAEFQSAFSEPKKSVEYLFAFDPNIISKNKIDSLALPVFIKQNILNYRNAGGKFNSPSDLKKIYGMNDSIYNLVQPLVKIENKTLAKTKPKKKNKEKVFTGTFDPNKAGSNDLKQFGFNTFQTNNVLSYRKNGGSFNNTTDLLKIYGIDTAFFLSIEKYIELEMEAEPEKPKIDQPKTALELNQADSLDLIKLNGIGPVYASRIIKYRNLLGGFYSKQQLLEVYNFPEETYRELESSIFVDSTLITAIRINFAEYNDLLKHPYLNKRQVNALIKFRENNGVFKNVSDIESVAEFENPGFKKIAPYFSCR